MIIFEDMGQKVEKHTLKNQWFYEHGIEVMRVPLPVGDYIIANDKAMDVLERKEKRGNKPKKMDFLGTYSIAVDTKENIGEIINNICGKAHGRFRDECILAQNNGVQLYILVENEDGVNSIEDLEKWQNPRLYRYKRIEYMHNLGKWSNIKLPKKPPTDGRQLALSMLTMQERYGVRFLFCHPNEAGAKVIELLEDDVDAVN
ncbi:MAG: hypothetical protein J5979_03695 [Lachnospiraceae bacterium]|nr:hypothetical protein [Lachnospiraceae bacterium]